MRIIDATGARDGEGLIRRLDLQALRIALAVADAGSMLRAADRIGLSQPAVSRAIKSLERTLGVLLFERGRRGVAPTPEGGAVLVRARSALDELRLVAAELSAIADPDVGEVRIGASPTVCAGFLPAALAAHAERKPGVSFRISEIDAERQVTELLAREIDLAIGRVVAVPPDRSIEVVPLYRERLVVVAGRGHPLARTRGKPSGAALARARWLLPPQGSALHREIVRALAGIGVGAPEVPVSAMSIPLRTSLLAGGRHLAVLHASMLSMDDAGLVVLPVDLDASIRIGLMRLGGRRRSPVAESFASTLKEFAAHVAASPAARAAGSRATRADA